MTIDSAARHPRGRAQLVDGVLAATFFAIAAMIDGAMLALGTDAVLAAIGIAGGLAVRRTYPVHGVVVVYTVGLITLIGTPLALGVSSLGVLGALFSVTAYGPRWAATTGLASGLVGCLFLGVRLASEQGLAAGALATMATMPLVVAAWAAGLLRGARTDARIAREDRYARLAVEREQELRLAAQTERSRIAREMHDIVAHSLTVMVAQADGGRYAGANEPAAATHALETIAETGRAALADMRRLLGVLRDEEADDGAGTGTLAPQPASGDLDALVEQVRSSGLRVSLVRMGNPRNLPPGVGLTAHRICQEALTNVLKHAGPDPTVTVLVQWTDTSLTIEVSDDGRGASADAEDGGHGLLGMRERAMMLGGTLSAGPRPGGGFRVRAQLPLPAPGGTP